MSTSTLPAASNWQRGEVIWTHLAPYLGQAIGAGVAIAPVYRLLVIKSFQQLGRPVPTMTLREAVIGGLKLAPSTGLLVGTQLVIQDLMPKVWRYLTGQTQHSSQQIVPSYQSLLLSSLATAVITAPIVAGFNGKAMGGKFWQSAWSLTRHQTGAIVAQESIFVFSISACEPVSLYMQKRLGDHPLVGYASAFFAGSVGSLCNHFANTALTRWQRELKVENLTQLMRGSPARALALGGFAVLYKLTKDVMIPVPCKDKMEP